jgi:hypothetical protein
LAAIRRYSQEAPHVIKERCVRAAELMKRKQEYEAMEILAGIGPLKVTTFPLESKKAIEGTP